MSREDGPMNILSLDFGGSSVKYGLVTQDGVVSDTGKCPAPLGSVDAFQDTVRSLAEEFRGRAQGIGVSIPGHVDSEKGVLLGTGVYRQLHGKNIRRLAERASALPVRVENDGNCGALSEVWKGQLQDCRDGAVIILGSAIGGGIVKDRRIHSGSGFSAGEFSYAVLTPGDYTRWTAGYMSAGMLGVTYKLCKLKNLDLSIQDAAPTLFRLDESLRSRYPVSTKPPRAIRADGLQFERWLDKGDPDAQQVYREFITALGAIAFNIQACYAPEKIVLAGGISAMPQVVPDVNREIGQYCQGMGVEETMGVRVVQSAFKSEANLLGAAYNFLQRMEE